MYNPLRIPALLVFYEMASSSSSASSSTATATTSSGLRISRVWSMAGIASTVYVKGKEKRESFLFDCGSIDELTQHAENVFVTHGHTGRYHHWLASCFSIIFPS